MGAFPSFRPDALPRVWESGSLVAGSFQALTAVSHLILPCTSRPRAFNPPDSPLAKEVHFRVSFCLTIASCVDRVSLYNYRAGVPELVTPHDLSPRVLPTVDGPGWAAEPSQATWALCPGNSALGLRGSDSKQCFEVWLAPRQVGQPRPGLQSGLLAERGMKHKELLPGSRASPWGGPAALPSPGSLNHICILVILS